MKEYITEKNGRKRKAQKTICNVCNKTFLKRENSIAEKNYCSIKCFANRKKKIELICAYCGKSFFRIKSKLSNSKSGLYFCCRKHKDLSQRIDAGFIEIQPDHYNSGDGTYKYRDKAFELQKHECAICGWNEDENILEVHHIDKNRKNDNISNLIILCPICHTKITRNRYKLIISNSIFLEKI